MKKKLLIFGVSGLTGYKIAKSATQKYDVFGTFNIRSLKLENWATYKLDLTNKDEVNKVFHEVKPDVVVNTTALHNVDYCEDNKDAATKVNTDAVKTLYENSEKFGSRLIHISTDYVFDGKNNSPYSERDQALPLSYYGKSKLDGEKILENSSHVVVRPSVVYGWTPLELAGTTSSSGKPMNFALWVLTKLSKDESLKIVTDQFASATLADSLAEGILKIASSDKSGLYHLSGLSCESRYSFTIKLAEKFGYDTKSISPITSSGIVQKAQRPAYSCLNCEKAKKDFGLKLLTTYEAIDVMKGQVEKEAPYLLSINK